MHEHTHNTHTRLKPFRAHDQSHASQKTHSDQKFLEELNLIHRQTDELSKGCCHCGFSCFHALKEDHEGIMQYRRSFSELPKAAQDRDLLWIFSGSAEVLPIQEEASPKSSPKGPEKQAQLIAVMRLRLRLSKPHHPVTQRMLRHLPFARK